MVQSTLAVSAPQRDGDRSWRRFAGPGVIVAAAALATAPEFIRGNSCGHDFNVHLVSWLDCLNAWRHGIAYPHWTPSANWGAGEPRFVFYPPLTWMAGAALGLALGWHWAPIALTFLILAGTGLATRALARLACDDAVAALAGCTAIFSGFALFTAYERAAFPEFTGGVWLPLLLFFALREDSQPSRKMRAKDRALARRAFDSSTVPLAIVLAACWLSNAPLGVIASYLLSGVALLTALLKTRWAPVLRAAVASALGLGATAFYWLPAKLEQRWVDIRQATQDPGYNFENNWAFAHHAAAALAMHDHILRQVSWIAVSMIAVALVSLLVCWHRGILSARSAPSLAQRLPDDGMDSSGAKAQPPPAAFAARLKPSPFKAALKTFPSTRMADRGWWVPLASIPAVTLFLLFPISRPVWHLLPEFRFLQYPWRWLEAVEAPMAIFFAAAVWPVKTERPAAAGWPAQAWAHRWIRRAIAGVCTAGFVCATLFAGTHFFQVCYPEDTVPSVLAAYRNGAGFEGMYEYAPPDSNIGEIATGLPDACLAAHPAAVLGQPNPDGDQPEWNASQHSCAATFAWEDGRATSPEHLRLRAEMPQSGYLVLRLLRFPAWAIQVNGRAMNIGHTASLPRRAETRVDGLIAVPVPRGPVDLRVDWRRTPDVSLSRWVSALAVLALAGMGLLERKLRRVPVS